MIAEGKSNERRSSMILGVTTILDVVETNDNGDRFELCCNYRANNA